MITFILVFFGLVIFHFILESTVLPSMRKEIRFRLFAQRDELRKSKLKFGDKISDEVFSDVQHSINVLVNILPVLDLGAIKKLNKEMSSNPNFTHKIKARIDLLNECKVEEVSKINQKVTNYAFTVIIVNSIGWAIYLAPFLLIALIIVVAIGFYNDIKRIFRMKINIVLHLPENKIEKLIPVQDMSSMRIKASKNNLAAS